MFVKNNIIKILLVVFALIIFIQFPTFATIGEVTTETLRLRGEPSTEGSIEDLLSIGQEVEIIEELEGWYKVSVNQKTGYVSKDYVKKEGEEVVSKPTETPIELIEANKISINENTKIYVIPLINAKTIGELKKDEFVTVVQTANSWSYVQTSSITGWVLASKLKVNTVAEQTKPQVEESQPKVEETENKEIKQESNEIIKTAYIKGDLVNIRKEPNTTCEVLNIVALNTQISIVGEENDWYKINYDNKTAYVLKSLVSDAKIEVTSRNAEIERIGTNSNKELAVSESGITGEDIVNYAKQYLGYDYKYATSGPDSFDCSGFTSYVYRNFGYTISRASSAQQSEGIEVKKEDLQLGDIIIFLNTSKTAVGHVGIYIGDDQFIHASSSKTGVIISSLSSGSYPARYVTARRIIY